MVSKTEPATDRSSEKDKKSQFEREQSSAVKNGEKKAKVEKSGEEEIDKILQEIESEYAQKRRMELIKQKKKTDAEIAKVQPFANSLKLADPKIVETIPEIFEEEGEKTVIDVVRLSARNSLVVLKKVALALTLILIVGLASDVYFRISPLGKAIYNQFFSTEIRLVTTPAGARVYIDDKRIAGKTPVSIDKLEPGVHQLTLSLEGFAPITRALYIPEEGELKISGAGVSRKGRTYKFSFKSTIELNSEPPGADILINGVKYPEKTPTSIEWPAEQSLTLAMEMPGFGRIDNFFVDFSEDSVRVEKSNVWTFSRSKNIINKYHVSGKLLKSIRLVTIPDNVEIFIDGESAPLEQQMSPYEISLTRGKHEILLKKEGYNDKLLALKVDENASRDITVVMDRPVQIVARETGSDGDQELAATVTKLVAGRTIAINRQTPCILSVPAIEAEIFVECPGFEPKNVILPADAREAVIELVPTKNPVIISVHDALTGLPLKQATIFYAMSEDSSAVETELGKTDEKGVLEAALKSDNYFLRAEKSGYYDRKTQVVVKDTVRVDFKLIIR